MVGHASRKAGEKMAEIRDLMEMSYEAKQKASGGRQHHEIFSDMLLEELGKLKGTDISPYLSVHFDVIKHNYDVHLRFPVRVNETYSRKRDIK